MKSSLAVMVLVAAMILTAPVLCAQDESAANDPATSDPSLVAAAAAPVQTVAPAEVLKMMQDKSAKFALIDTQPVEGYTAGHIPGAISYPWAMQIKSFPIPLPRDRVLIFYGSCPNDTSDTVRKLAEFGYFNIKIMDGGWYKWLELKYPTAGPENSSPDLSQLTSPRASNSKTISR
ncbi:MAG TPA: rhodanese-like domain-containing protein [Candidatus Acidoferrales bacterium]|jgi:rhodanese-related sulfurtransferase|nr:rhodanese-like domain-containing protein [Candidatus Acidoferrales bacterium]